MANISNPDGLNLVIGKKVGKTTLVKIDKENNRYSIKCTCGNIAIYTKQRLQTRYPRSCTKCARQGVTSGLRKVTSAYQADYTPEQKKMIDDYLAKQKDKKGA